MNFSYLFVQLFLVLALVQFAFCGDEVIENVNKNEVEDLKGKPINKNKLDLLRMGHNQDDLLHL